MNRNKYVTSKIAAGFIALLALAYFGYQFVAGKLIDNKKFAQIEPGHVTLLGIDAGAGYKIIVSNEVAQLVQVPAGKMEASDSSMDSDSDATDKRHVPLKETIESLQGDNKALSSLVTTMNDDLRKYRSQIPPQPVIWRAADINAAIKGDPKLTPKLEHDLNVKLDGTPADFITINALYNGITIDLPVPVTVDVKGVPTQMTAHVKVPFRAQFTRDVEKLIDNDPNMKSVNPSSATIKGYYLQLANKLQAHPDSKEHVARSIAALIDPAVVKAYADAAQRVLGNTRVVLNENFIQSATKEDDISATGKPMYDLVLNLTEEGRERLWKYSRHRIGSQLLLIVDGVAIAAPYVRHELAQSTVSVTQMPDASLVQDALDDINKSTGKVASK